MRQDALAAKYDQQDVESFVNELVHDESKQHKVFFRPCLMRTTSQDETDDTVRLKSNLKEGLL